MMTVEGRVEQRQVGAGTRQLASALQPAFPKLLRDCRGSGRFGEGHGK